MYKINKLENIKYKAIQKDHLLYDSSWMRLYRIEHSNRDKKQINASMGWVGTDSSVDMKFRVTIKFHN